MLSVSLCFLKVSCGAPSNEDNLHKQQNVADLFFFALLIRPGGLHLLLKLSSAGGWGLSQGRRWEKGFGRAKGSSGGN